MAEQLEVEVRRIPVAEIRLLEKNARFMKAETFQRLVENIKRDGVLTQLPFVVPEGDAYRCISGNHRVMGAEAAGLTEIDVIVCDQELPPDRLRAIQLSHNAIVGEDDPVVLADLYSEIADVAWRAYSGLADEAMDKATAATMAAAKLQTRQVTLLFLPDEIEELNLAFGILRASLKTDEAWIAPMVLYERFLDTIDCVGLSFDIRSTAVAFLALIELLKPHLHELAEALPAPGRDFPLPALFKRFDVPRPEARQVAKALASTGENDPWDALVEMTKPAPVASRTMRSPSRRESPGSTPEPALQTSTGTAPARARRAAAGASGKAGASAGSAPPSTSDTPADA